MIVCIQCWGSLSRRHLFINPNKTDGKYLIGVPVDWYYTVAVWKIKQKK